MKDLRPAFLIPYDGSWPTWLPFFLESCGWNPEFTWLLIGHALPERDLPPNVHWLPADRDALTRRFAQKIGFAPPRDWEPYKLCDWRPALGLLFAEELSGFSHWGHCDLDILFGDMSPLLRHLADADVLSAGPASTGHCQLYRNDPHLNRLFLNSGTIRRGLRFPLNLALDEPAWGCFLARTSGLQWKRLSCQRSSAEEVRQPVGATLLFDGRLAGHPLRPQKLLWKEGRVYAEFSTSKGLRREEFLYLHFLAAKAPTTWQNLATTAPERPAMLYFNLQGPSIEPCQLSNPGTILRLVNSMKTTAKLLAHAFLFAMIPILWPFEKFSPRVRFRWQRAYATMHRFYWLKRWEGCR
jgi:hypothetical protein